MGRIFKIGETSGTLREQETLECPATSAQHTFAKLVGNRTEGHFCDISEVFRLTTWRWWPCARKLFSTFKCARNTTALHSKGTPPAPVISKETLFLKSPSSLAIKDCAWCDRNRRIQGHDTSSETFARFLKTRVRRRRNSNCYTKRFADRDMIALRFETNL